MRPLERALPILFLLCVGPLAAPAAPPADPSSVPSAARVAPAGDGAPSAVAVWNGDPIAAPLVVGVERRIEFPQPVAELDVPEDVERRSRIVLAPDGRLHWRALEPFAPARVLATAIDGTLYQLDVGAGTAGAPPPPLTLVDPVLAAAAARDRAPDDRARLEQAAAALIPEFLTGPPAPGGSVPDYVALARFALAHYSGPERLIPPLDAARVPVRPVDARWVRASAGAVTVRPLAQWQVGARYVTALDVRNRGAWPTPFEPRALRGALVFAAALQPTLGPAGSGHHRTVWVVITEQPFDQAVAHGPAPRLTR